MEYENRKRIRKDDRLEIWRNEEKRREIWRVNKGGEINKEFSGREEMGEYRCGRKGNGIERKWI